MRKLELVIILLLACSIATTIKLIHLSREIEAQQMTVSAVVINECEEAGYVYPQTQME